MAIDSICFAIPRLVLFYKLLLLYSDYDIGASLRREKLAAIFERARFLSRYGGRNLANCMKYLEWDEKRGSLCTSVSHCYHRATTQ